MATGVLQTGEVVVVTIDNIAFGGAGVGRGRLFRKIFFRRRVGRVYRPSLFSPFDQAGAPICTIFPWDIGLGLHPAS